MDHNYSSPTTALWLGQSPSLEKSSQILLREYPHRSLAIATDSHALILRHSIAANDAVANAFLASPSLGRQRMTALESAAPKCMVEFTRRTEGLLADYRPLTPRPIYGTLGLIALERDVFLCVITQASRVATLRPGETVEKIEAVQFFCLSSADYDNVPALDPYDPDSDAASIYSQGLGRQNAFIEHPCQELQKLLGNGSFYYSTDFDVTNRMQDRPVDAAEFDIDNFDESFLWNSFMIRPLVLFRSRLQKQERDALDASRILTSAIRGFCRSWAIPQSVAPLSSARSGLPSYLTVISRLSCKRAGTRFNSRGIDDDGNVANFVETETTYWSPSGVVFSYAQVRGSVPVFWEQAAGLLPNQQKITITRSADGTQPAFDQHFHDLEQAYGAVHVVNLLSATKPGEHELTTLYREGVRNCPLSRPGGGRSRDHALLRETEYDFHAETKGPQGYVAANGIRRHIEHSADGFAYYLAQESDDAGTPGGQKRRRYVVVLQQEGVFRTNCLDCLDRTNLIQTIISQMAVESFLGHRGERALSDFWSRHANLWADNGDSLSKIYAGTGALKSSFTRTGKMSLAGAIADVRKSATRLYYNNFADKARQITIDTLLGRMVGQAPVILFDPISDYVAGELQRRSHEYSTNEKIHILVGTFNLNGRTEGLGEDLSPWLCPPELGSIQPEIIAIGFQEIVELNPQQIMNSDPTRKQLWERAIKSTLDQHYGRGGDKYVLLRSGQLVGAALCIFVKASVLHHIKNVEGSVKKTGMSGMAGNKGAVAIRLDYANTPICFVTAHLAAGFANYEERNRDYATIDQGLWFQRNRGIRDHDSVIWFGDFNYRIGLDLETTKGLVKCGDIETLFENDQLNLQMVAGLAFQYYSESRITFMPTYKYDVGTDVFDTSEKARIPAWTDRILRKGPNLRQLAYNSAPLRFSDHRPVYAIFECTVNIVNEKRRDKISREIYERRKAEVGGDTATLIAHETDDEDLIGYDAIEPGLPPASSDRQKWWLEGGKMARTSISPPKPEHPGSQTILNPKRPTNPHVPTDEPDWKRKPVPPKTTPVQPSAGPRPAASAPVQAQPPKPKAAPPVAKKPAHLAAPVSPASSTAGSIGSEATLHGSGSAVDMLSLALPPAAAVAEKPASQRLTPTMANANGFKSDLSRSLASLQAQMGSSQPGITADMRPLQPMRRANSSAGAVGVAQGVKRSGTAPPAGGIPLVGLAQATAAAAKPMAMPLPVSPPPQQERKPPLPSRKPTAPIPVPGHGHSATAAAAAARKKGPPPPPQHPQPQPIPLRGALAAAVDLLADDGASELSGWEALKPSS
ncbi:hypothetical protein VTJ49DRAFT_5254 [Mycothermus thermophilus]|uniref:phosphoinositide 5-phosphatase n=1 Tax=Humicola insolens TaxID=85995 RepID=A0ABR3V3J1_HUMIN